MEAINKLKAFSKPINFLSFSGGIRDICFVLCCMEEGGEIFEKKDIELVFLLDRKI